MAGKIIPIAAGLRYDRWVVLGLSPVQYLRRGALYLCQCDCGIRKPVRASHLRAGTSRSCGCIQRETAANLKLKHGKAHIAEYKIWSQMRTRCGNPNAQKYHVYGGRGITVCERWASFANFYADMGPRPSSKHSIDRFPDNNGNYEPGNCRWATQREQMNNLRTSRWLTFDGVTHTLTEWARLLGLNPSTLAGRLDRGWSVEDAFRKPVMAAIARRAA